MIIEPLVHQGYQCPLPVHFPICLPVLHIAPVLHELSKICSLRPIQRIQHVKDTTCNMMNKKLDRFKQWAGERMGGEVKTNVSDDFKSLELEMTLRHEGQHGLM